MAKCVVQQLVRVAGTPPVEQSTYINSFEPMSTCETSSGMYVIMEDTEYSAFIAANQLDDTQDFTDLYDLGFDGIVEMWVLGLGIGLSLAMLAKLKR